MPVPQPPDPARPPSGPSSPVPAALAYRVTATAFAVAPVLVLVAVAFAAPPATESLPLWLTAAIIATVLASGVLAELIGYQIEPLASLDQTQVGLARLQQAAVLRFALVEATIIIAMVLAFVLPYGWWPALVGVVVGLPTLAFHVWPSRRMVGKTADRLESRGMPSGVREAFGHR
ncbi:MAG: hypothetical protein QM621_12915 [Aeromicrobium sp.]|uniref:hypothetical protein n=1 Tax=Aeromicrobium sp. TaxID=1871063 RepID=UPI0039E54B4B